MENKIVRIAIQKSGRLTKKTMQILKQAGLEFDLQNNVLFSLCPSFPVELMLVRDDDIPEYIADGICDLGFVGYNVLLEKMLKKNLGRDDIPILKKLGFGNCRLSLAIPKEEEYTDLSYFSGKTIATSYPKILEDFFRENNISTKVIEISGSVEITPKLKIADAICDIVSSGSTLRGNNLKEVAPILQSESVLIKSTVGICSEKLNIIERLLRRIDGVEKAANNKYIMMNANVDSIEEIKKILPGVEEPSIMPLDGIINRVAIHVVCQENIFWETMEKLKAAGASSILVLPIEKYIA